MNLSLIRSAAISIVVVPVLVFAQQPAAPAPQTPIPPIPTQTAQTGPTLTLEQAIQLATQRNGDVRTAVLNERSARAAVQGARANFFPNITPSYSYNSQRTQNLVPGGGTAFNQNEGATTAISATWRLLDLG